MAEKLDLPALPGIRTDADDLSALPAPDRYSVVLPPLPRDRDVLPQYRHIPPVVRGEARTLEPDRRQYLDPVYETLALPDAAIQAGRLGREAYEDFKNQRWLSGTSNAAQAVLTAPTLPSKGIFLAPVAAANLAKQGITGPARAFERAATMSARPWGSTPSEIYAETNKLLEGTPYAGISRGPYGNRFELTDDKAFLKNLPKSEYGNFYDAWGPLRRFWDHPELYKAHPEWWSGNGMLAHLLIGEPASYPGMGQFRYESGMGLPKKIPEVFAANRSIPGAETIVAHELQHAAQTAGHGDRYSWRDKLRDFPFVPGAYNRYFNSDRELEARLTEFRKDMSAPERRAEHPDITMSRMPREPQSWWDWQAQKYPDPFPGKP